MNEIRYSLLVVNSHNFHCVDSLHNNSDLTREVTRNDDDDKIDDSHADTTMALVEIEDTIFWHKNSNNSTGEVQGVTLTNHRWR